MKGWLWAALLLATGAQAQGAASRCSGGETLTAHDLEARGWGRLHEVLRWTSWTTAPTVDGYDVLPGVRPVGAGRLRWLIDGLPAAGPAGIEPDGVEWLPVALTEIDRVTVCPGPGLAAGAWGGPWVEIDTRRPVPHAGGAVDYGNETGDPGPARYLMPGAPNVDHWGPDFEAAVSAGPNLWATMRDRGLFPTDTAMASRVTEALVPGRFPARAVTVGAVHAQLGGWTLRGGAVRGADLPHVPALGREVPVARRHLSGSGGGPVARLGALRVQAHVHAARLSLYRPAWGALPVDPAWTEWRGQAGLDAALERPAGSLRAGLQAEQVHAAAPGLTRPAVTVGRAWGQAAQAFGGGHIRTATLTAAVAGGDMTLSGDLEQRWRLEGGVVTLHLATHRRAGSDTPTLADWTARGYTGLGGTATLEPSVAGAAIGTRPAQREAVARLSGTRALASTVWATWTVEVQQSTGSVEEARFVLAPGAAAVEGRTETLRAAGVAAHLRGDLAWGQGPVGVRLFGVIQGPVSAQGAFDDAWARWPLWRAGAEATLRPDAQLGLWLRVDAHGATRWAGYPVPRVPATMLVDLGLSRRLWRDRLRLSLAGRNVTGGWTGATERPHPLGATLAPRLFVRLDGRF